MGDAKIVHIEKIEGTSGPLSNIVEAATFGLIPAEAENYRVTLDDGRSATGTTPEHAADEAKSK